MPLRPLIAASAAAFACLANAQSFDWDLLAGQWAESTNHQFGCRSDNLHHQFVVSPDKRRLTFKLDRRWEIGTGERVTEYGAAILSAQPHVLVIKYGPELQGIPDAMREWELRLVGPGTYRWRSTAWAEDRYNDVIGVRCR